MTADEKDEPVDAGRRLDMVRDNALHILAEASVAPSRLRVQSGDASVDIDWPAPVPTAGADPALSAVPVEPTAVEPASEYLIAQTVGVFYPCPGPGTAPFVSEGDDIVEGQQVGIIEAMKLMIPVNADRVGRIAEVLKSHAEPVEYGDRLFALAPDSSP